MPKRIKKEILNSNKNINGISWLKGEELNYNENGNLINKVERHFRLLKSTKIDNISYKINSNIFFDKDGKVERGKLFDNTKINRVIYKANNSIFFYEDGKFKQGILAEDATIDGSTYNANDWIRFNPDGSVHSSSSSFDLNF